MSNQKVLVVGGGGREHALCLALNNSSSVGEVHCCPGNAGTLQIATNHSIQADDIDSIVELATNLSVDLVVVGPEAPLCDSLADKLNHLSIPCFGPVAALANLEGSKLHAKEGMQKVGVPTAGFDVLDSKSDIEAMLVKYSEHPFVIKRDVLAGGKGVVVTSDFSEAREFIEHSIEQDGKVLLEEFLPGEEASMLVIMDGSGFVCLPASQDHKRAYDGDEGPNTGGMGAYCPAPVVTDEIKSRVVEEIVAPMHKHLSSLDTPYRGVLYVGLMITESGQPNVVEFNVRFGDPECQITLPLIKTDLFKLLQAAAMDELVKIDVDFHNAHAATVVLASQGYPASPTKGLPITGIPESGDVIGMGLSWINHAGTKLQDGKFVSSGGRVLSCTAMESSLEKAVQSAYGLISKISLEGSHYRTDIGAKAMK